MALTHEKKDRHLYPLSVFLFFCTNLHHLQRKAVTKGAPNVPGGLVSAPLTE